MYRKAVVIGLTVLLLLVPLVLVFLRTPIVTTLLPVKNQTSDRYSVSSDVPGYTLVLANTSYLDYVTANAGVFGQNAVVDPTVYRKIPVAPTRFTVSSIRFVLGSTPPSIPLSIIVGDGATTPAGIIGQGGYAIEHGVLVVSVWLNIKTLTDGKLLGKFSFDDAFVRTAIHTLYYARGLTTSAGERDTLVNVTQDMQQNLYSGIFPWPFRIVTK